MSVGLVEYAESPIAARIGSTLMTPVVTPRSPSIRGRRQLSRDVQVGVHPDVSHRVVDHLEVGRLQRQIHAADLELVNRQVAGDRQRLLLVVEDGDAVGMDAIGLQIDPAVKLGVRRPRSTATVKAAFWMVTAPVGCGSPAVPTTSILACTRPVTSVSAVVNP